MSQPVLRLCPRHQGAGIARVVGSSAPLPLFVLNSALAGLRRQVTHPSSAAGVTDVCSRGSGDVVHARLSLAFTFTGGFGGSGTGGSVKNRRESCRRFLHHREASGLTPNRPTAAHARIELPPRSSPTVGFYYRDRNIVHNRILPRVSTACSFRMLLPRRSLCLQTILQAPPSGGLVYLRQQVRPNSA